MVLGVLPQSSLRDQIDAPRHIVENVRLIVGRIIIHKKIMH